MTDTYQDPDAWTKGEVWVAIIFAIAIALVLIAGTPGRFSLAAGAVLLVASLVGVVIGIVRAIRE